MARPIQPPPQRHPLTQNDLVDGIWNRFFVSIYQLFSLPSYGYRQVDLSATNITGTYSISASYLTDRDFVDYYITITPSTSINLSATNITGFLDTPVNPVYPCKVYQVTSASDIVYSGEGSLFQTGDLSLPDLSGSDRILIQGRFIRQF